MNNGLKNAGKYVTFVPTNKEYPLIGTSKGLAILANDEKYLEYGFEATQNFKGQVYYQLVIDTIDKLGLFTNAYDLHYEANYLGDRYKAMLSSDQTIVTLYVESYDKPNIAGFRNYSQGEWIKDIEAPEAEIIAVKEPIDLSKYLPTQEI
ncbi:hypothetical protein [Listeria aquatica]|uniref:hypothetical protein n=1 Tax=Listeria aquatica TaxID=1494960 RepID=UPI0031F57D26